MALSYISLDDATRQSMLAEFTKDIDNGTLYFSKRFNENGLGLFPDLMKTAIASGNDDTLGDALRNMDCFLEHEEKNTASGIKLAKVPVNAHQVFSEGEFNRFYIRALCLRAINENRRLEVYRARHSDNPRATSEALIGATLDPHSLIEDLRNNKGFDTHLGLPNGPNSGLSVKLN